MRRPRLCLFAIRDIHKTDELLYDYGDGKNLWCRQKEVLFLSEVTGEFYSDSSPNTLPVSDDEYVEDSCDSFMFPDQGTQADTKALQIPAHTDEVEDSFESKTSEDKELCVDNCEMDTRDAVRRGGNLLRSAIMKDDIPSSQVFNRMRSDEVKDVAFNDSLIRRYAALRVESLGDKDDKKLGDMHRISQGVRTLGRLVIIFKNAVFVYIQQQPLSGDHGSKIRMRAKSRQD